MVVLYLMISVTVVSLGQTDLALALEILSITLERTEGAVDICPQEWT